MRTRAGTWLAVLGSIVLTAAGAAFGAGIGSGTAMGSLLSTSGTTTTTTTTTVPGAPTLVSASAGSDGVTLTWTPPADDGGSPIVHYWIYRGNASGGEVYFDSVDSRTQYTDVNAIKGRPYTYEVSAVTDVGTGPLSNELGVTAVGPVAAPIFDRYQAYQTGSWPEAVAVGDVTGDGRPDVVMTTSYNLDPLDDYHLFVYAQNADGTLAPPVSYLTAGGYSTRPTSVAIGDITGDGRNDVVVGVDRIGVQVFPQLASGALGSPTTTSTTDGQKIRLGRLNGDGKLDLVGVGWGTNTVSVLLNNGSGGLSPPSTYAALHGGYDDLEVGDVTGDGRDDIVVMSGQLYADPNVSVLPQLAGGGFGPAAGYSIGTNVLTSGIGVGDVTGDGRNDVVATDSTDGKLAVFAQTGVGTLGTPTLYAGSGGPVEIADLDADGRPDVATLAGGTSAGVYRQKTDGTLATEELSSVPYATSYNPHGLALGDINGDGLVDLASANYNSGLVVLRNALPPAGATVPGAPVLTSATAGQQSVTLTWTPPAVDGGSPIRSYRVYRITGSGPERWAGDATGTSFTDTNVVGGFPYYYRVAAGNAVGWGPFSNQLSARLPAATPPDAPLLAEATPSYDRVLLDWNPPASDGGASISGYRIFRGTASGAETFYATAPAGTTTFADTAAKGGTTYYYEVSAVNSAGESTFSNELSATPLTPTAPGAPALTVAAGDYSKVRLTWKPGSDGGATITGYKLYRGTSSGGETLLTTLGNLTSYDDTSGNNGTTYFYEVTAVNSAGESGVSNELSAAPVAPTPPSSPSLWQAAAGYSSVTLQWDGPSSNGGASVIGYNVYRGTASGGETLLTTLDNVLSYTDTSGVNGTTYYYRVTARNALGESLPSNELSASPIRRLFDPYQSTAVGSWPEAVAIGDVTGDGRNDVVATTSFYFDDANDYHLFVFAQRADGTLAPPVSYLTAATYDNRPLSVAVGDITGDGKADVVVGLVGLGVQVFPQLASGALGTPTLTPSTDVGVIRLGQLDGDGRLDVANAGSAVSVFLNNGQGGLKPPVGYGAGGSDLEVADVTNDGRDDIVVLPGQNVSVLPQLSLGGFGSPAVYSTGANAWGTQGIGAGDVNGDGRADVVVSYGGNSPNSFIAVLAQGADGTLGAPKAYTTLDIPEPVETADFDLDGLTDVALLHGGTTSAGVHRQGPGGMLLAEERYAIPSSSHYDTNGLAVGDVNGDGSPDVVAVGFTTGVSVLRNTTAPTNVPAAPALTGATADKTAVNLTWKAPPSQGGSAAGYRVYRGTASGRESLLATLGTATSFADSTAVPGTTYYYQVSAVNSRGEGARSSERPAAIVVPDATAPSTPGSPKLAVAGTNQIALDWAPSTDNVGVTGYRVYRNNVLVATVPSAQYLDGGLAAATSYAYTVRAIDAAGNASGASNGLTAKTVSQTTSNKGTLAGAVFDVTGKPLANALVTIGSKTAKTNTSGAWEVANLAPGKYTVSVSLTGYRGQAVAAAAVAGKTVLMVTALTK